MKTELFDEVREGDPIADIAAMVVEANRLEVEFSPIPGDLTCKIKFDAIDFLISIDNLIDIVNALPEGFIEKAKT